MNRSLVATQMMTRNSQGYWSNRDVAVTGATGFVGHHVATQLVAHGANVTALVRPTSNRRRLIEAGVRCVDVDLQDSHSIAKVCDGCEVLFHVAGVVDFEPDWERFWRVNVEGTRNVLAAATRAGIRRVVHTSSIVAVGARDRPRVQDETAHWNLGRLKVPYVASKRAAEELALAESGRGVEVVVVNPASVIGPDDFSSSEFGTLCRRFWRGRLPFYFGAGGNNFVDVRDVAAGHLLAAQHGRPGQRYILGGHNKTYTSFFASLAGCAPKPIFRLRLPDGLGAMAAGINQRLRGRRKSRSYLTPGQARMLSLFFYFDSSRARRELGYQVRPLSQTVADAFTFWIGRRQAG